MLFMQQYALDADFSSPFNPLLGPVLDGAIPVRRYKKGLITTGEYVHPQDDWELEVTPERLESWVETFQQMKRNGVKVPVVRVHSFEDDPDNTLGYLEDMFVDSEGWLSGIHELRGLQSMELAERVGQVSVGIEKDFQDGKGNKYGEAITHVAITPIPVVPNQGEFERIAASRHIQVLKLSREVHSMLNQKELSRIAELVGDETITADNALDVLEARFKSLSSSNELKDKYAASLKKIERLEASVVPVGDPEVLEDRAQLYGERIDRIAQEGKVPSEVADKLKLCLLGDAEKRNALALCTHGGRDKAWAKEVISLLEEIPARVEFGTKTGPQCAVASDHGRSGDDGFNPDVHKKMRKLAGLREG